MFSKQNPAGPEQAVQMTTMSKHQLTDKPKHHYITGGLALLALSLFVTAGALAVVKPITEASPPPVYQARQVLDLPSPLPAFGESASIDAPFMDETRIRSGDTLAAVLQRLNIQESNLQQFLVQEESARSIY